MRLPRFRLRTLMIAVAIVGLLLVWLIECLPGDFIWISIGGHTFRIK
jgi:hypothetical protein